MELKVLGSTMNGYQMPNDVALDFGAKMAGICYMPDDFEKILAEPVENTLKRVKKTLASGHHSVYDHVYYTLLLSRIPKIVVMVLNNENIYTTSEKSARYTKMEPSPREKILYYKWLEIFKKKVSDKYYDKFYAYQYKQLSGKSKVDDECVISEKANKATTSQIEKIAQENARYMISVFTPTTLAHTLSLRQINYIRYMMQDFIENFADTREFYLRIKEEFKNFLEITSCFEVPELIPSGKERHLSLFDTRSSRREEFGENYSINYKMSFATYAQAHRHRTLDYTMKLLDTPEYYVPEMIKEDKALEQEWLSDISSVGDVYPQGMLVMANERGTYEKFMEKCTERLCGFAQLEVCLRTRETLHRYLDEVKDKDEEVYNELLRYSNGARCTFPTYKCKSPCVWGNREVFTRKV